MCGTACNVTPGTCPGSNGCWDLPYGCQTCKDGYVWRDAAPQAQVDQICVTPDARNRVADENANAANTVDPNSSPYCLQGYVWREAYGSNQADKVCVTVSSRSQAAAENAAHRSHTVVYGN